MGSFGEKFRAERERRGFTLDDVSNVTKIGARMLEAIEQERFDILPGGVFNKGFVRAYAKHLGFNDQQAVGDYLIALRQAQLQAHAATWDLPLPPPTAHLNTNSFFPPASETAPSETKINFVAADAPATAVKPGTLRPIADAEIPAFDSTASPRIPEPAEQPLSIKPLVMPPSSRLRNPTPESVPVNTQSPSPLPSETLAPRMLQGEDAQHASQTLIVTEADTRPDLAFREKNRIEKNRIEKNRLEKDKREKDKREKETLNKATEETPEHAASLQRYTSILWKIPALGIAALAVAALLWSHYAGRPAGPVAAHSEVASSPAVVASNPPAPERSAAPKKSAVEAKALESKSSSTAPAPLSVVTKPKATPPTPPRRTASAKPKAPAPFHLSIRASQNCWISVTADGELVSRENLIAPANTTVRASREIVVRVSDPAAVTFRINDRPISIVNAANGNKTLLFDRAGLRRSPAEGRP
ncbi:MAG TPA: RodZ domain-containing protein [Candidatus Sulfotelmatobacter sp.]